MQVYGYMQSLIQYSRTMNTYFLSRRRQVSQEDAAVVDDAMTFM